MIQRRLGLNGPLVSALGLGCMGMSEFYGATDEKESMAVLDKALELGCNFWDTADMYGPHKNEELVGRALKGRREKVFLATKFGIVRAADPAHRGFDGKPAYVQGSCEASLRRLGVDVIDLYYLHRVDPATPVEDTAGAMAKLVKQGKVRYLGLSEAGPADLRKAHAVHPITALQSEYSLWTRDPEEGPLQACRELGIGFVAFSPLGRGALAGRIKAPTDLGEGDFRKNIPRYQGDNFEQNLRLVGRLEAMAARRGCQPSQAALAWVLAQGGDIVPIPGTKHMKYLEENLGALDVALGLDDLRELQEMFPKGAVAGERWTKAMAPAKR